ncbi:MAG: hypothetical protein QXP36_13095 [Conexivisphaerales archaeon]
MHIGDHWGHKYDRLREILKLGSSVNAYRTYQFMNEITSVYKGIDLTGKYGLNVGADSGFSSMYFINQGAIKVVAFSLDKRQKWLSYPRTE